MQVPTWFKSLNMSFTPRILSSAAAVAVTCLVTAAAYYYRSRKTEVNEVMIVSKLQFNVFNYFDKLISFIEAAKHSVHICMPSIHNPVIQGRLVKLIKRKNIKVRIVIDEAGYNDSTNFFLKELAEAGAEIKWKVSEHRMQDKFCLVDDEVLISGTLDWGNNLSLNNWNYIYITNKVQLVEPVKSKFYITWEGCQITIPDVLRENNAVIEDVLSIVPSIPVDMETSQDLSETFEVINQELPDYSEKTTRANTPVIEIQGAA